MRIFFSAGITGGRLIVLRPSSRGIASATNNPLPLSLTRDTDYKGRNVIERRYCHLQQWRGLATHTHSERISRNPRRNPVSHHLFGRRNRGPLATQSETIVFGAPSA